MRHLMLPATAFLVLMGAMVANPTAAPGAPAKERFVLSGVVAFDDGDGRAWLQEPTLTQNRVFVVRRGDSIGPWRVTGIFRNRVELEGPGGKVLIPLHNAGGAVAASPAPARSAVASPPPTAAPSVPLGDPSRRQAIKELTGFLGQGSNTGPAATAPPPAPPDFSAPPARSTEPPKTIYIKPGDPRRRESIGELFGTR